MKIVAYYVNPNGSKPTAELEIIPNILVHFRRCDDYDGGFGFDWMRDEYIYTTKDLKENLMTDEWDEVSQSPVCRMNEELKKQYKQMYDNRKTPYYIPWLSMFPNHESRIGEKVRLQLKVEIMDPQWKKSKVKFDCPPGIHISPAEIQLTTKDTISQNAKGKKEGKYTSTIVEVYCDSPHAGGEITIRTKADRNNPVEKEVGKLNLYRNDKEYPLKIRLVKIVREEFLESDRKYIDDRTPKILRYLKSKSLQQAMIVSEIESVKEIVISERHWAAEGKLKEEDDPDDYHMDSPKRKVFSITNNDSKPFTDLYKQEFEYDEKEVACEVYEEYDEFKSVRKKRQMEKDNYLYENGEALNGKKTIKTHNPFKGIVIIIANIYNQDSEIAASGHLHPTHNNTCLITRKGLNKEEFGISNPQKYYPTVAHEIGHVLSLNHTFDNDCLNNKNTEKHESYKKRLTEYEEILPEEEINIIMLKRNLDKELKETIINEKIIKEYSERITSCSENIIICKNGIHTLKRFVESYEWFRDHLKNNFCFYFDEGKTDNIMDYKKNEYNKFKFFFTLYQWQWVPMQKDLMKFHSK